MVHESNLTDVSHAGKRRPELTGASAQVVSGVEFGARSQKLTANDPKHDEP